MKKLIFIPAIICLLVSGCKINDFTNSKTAIPKSKNVITNNSVENKNIEKNKSKINEDFSKKQECALYRDEIEKTLKDLYNGTYSNILDEIFYSPKQNSCLYSYKSYPLVKDGIKNLGIDYSLVDYLTNEMIVSVNTNLNENAAIYFSDVKKEYKE